jgi:hypothetical protein
MMLKRLHLEFWEALQSGLPDFPSYNIPKQKEYTKRTQNSGLKKLLSEKMLKNS